MQRLLAAIAVCAVLAPAAATAAEGSVEARVSAAFERLGMDPEKSACYGRVIDARLNDENGDKAARIVETAKNGDDVRNGVNEEAGRVRGAFMLAKANCG